VLPEKEVHLNIEYTSQVARKSTTARRKKKEVEVIFQDEEEWEETDFKRDLPRLPYPTRAARKQGPTGGGPCFPFENPGHFRGYTEKERVHMKLKWVVMILVVSGFFT